MGHWRHLDFKESGDAAGPQGVLYSPAGLPTSLGSLCVLTGFRWNHLQEPDSLPDRVPVLLPTVV